MQNKKASQIQEKRVAKTLGEKVVAGSGSTDFLKGDVFGTLFIECKTNANPRRTITVKKEWFDKAKKQAFQMRRQDFAISFSFDNQTDYYAVDENLFNDMYRSYKAIQQLIDEIGLDEEYNLSESEGVAVRNEIRAILKENL